MTTYTNIFGGNTVKAADVSYTSLTISANTALSWPSEGQTPATSAIMEIAATTGSLSVTLPDARLVGNGESVTIKNTGANTFAVKDYAGGSVLSIANGNVYTIYLKDNATAAGSWGYWQAGAGSSTVDASAIDGAGLEAAAGLLRVKMDVNLFTTSQAFADNDRGSMAVWTGGSGTFTMPQASAVGDGWFMHFKNDGSGTLQIVSSNSETFDGDSDITLAAGEGVLVASNGINFSYVSAASSANSSDFSYTTIAVGGSGTYTLTSAEYAKVALKFTGTLTGNRTIVVPTAIRDYWVNNATSGAFTLTVKTASGSGVAVTQGKSATLYCDGTDVIAADTDYPSGVATPVAIADGGTGAITADAALTNLGGTTVGKQVFTAANAAAVRSAAGLGNAATLNETSAAEFRNNTADRLLSTDQVWSAADTVALTWSAGGNTAVDLNAGLNFTLAASAGNSTLAAPTNAKTGQSGFIYITQDSTPRTLAYASAWIFAGGADPALSTGAGVKDILFYQVISSTGPVVYATLVKNVA